MSKAKPSWPQIGAPLDGVNADFHQAYEALSQSATQAFPMFVLIDHELVIVWNQCERRIPITPRAFHVLKSVAHAPVGVYALLLPACDGPLPPQLRSHVQAALERLPVELPDAHETAKQVIETTRAFLSQVLADQAVTKAALDNFAQVMGPRLLELTDAATRLALASLHAAVQEAWQACLNPLTRSFKLSLFVTIRHGDAACMCSIFANVCLNLKAPKIAWLSRRAQRMLPKLWRWWEHGSWIGNLRELSLANPGAYKQTCWATQPKPSWTARRLNESENPKARPETAAAFWRLARTTRKFLGWQAWIAAIISTMHTEDPSLKDTLKKVQRGRGRKIVYLILSIVGVSIIVGAYLLTTRGTDFDESAAAMADPFRDQPVERKQQQDAEAPKTP